MAEAASRHAGDPEYDSPYMQLARQQGLDLPWWQKVQKASFVDGKFSMGGLKVREMMQRSCPAQQPRNACVKRTYLWHGSGPACSRCGYACMCQDALA